MQLIIFLFQIEKVTYTILINGCVASGEYQKAWKVFDACRVNSLLNPDPVTYSVLINACAREQLVEKAINLFEDMERKGIKHTEVTYNSLLYAMAKRPDILFFLFFFQKHFRSYHSFTLIFFLITLLPSNL